MKATHGFVAYQRCGCCASFFAVDFGENDPVDGDALMDALRCGQRVGWLPIPDLQKIPLQPDCGKRPVPDSKAEPT